MSSNTGYIMTLANSIIGVGILAMPFCFQKCGILLSIVLLIASNLMTRLSCHYLLKTSIKTRRKNFEFLASNIFGPSGKLLVELCVIGYLMGSCITYFVVVGDLGPQIFAKLFDINLTDSLRTSIMILITIFCIIPLGLLKNIESLSHVCIISILFYFCLVVKIMCESEEKIASGHWYENIYWWRPSGILQCIPIFSMALSCQMQLFEIYESLPNQSLEKMNEIVKMGTGICTGVYILVGLFGYIAFSGQQQFSGNILLSLTPSTVSDIIKLGFVLTVAFSFPLVIFPCRASLYSLLYHRSHSDAAHYIPEHRFKLITICLVLTGLIIGIMIPSIELVIGLVGSTIGVAICVIFPASCFIKTNKKNSTEKLLAQFLLVFGFCIMILGTYANLSAIEEQQSAATVIQFEKPQAPILPIVSNSNPLPERFELSENGQKNIDRENLLAEKAKESLPVMQLQNSKRKPMVKLNQPQEQEQLIREIDLSSNKNNSHKTISSLQEGEKAPINTKQVQVEVKPPSASNSFKSENEKIVQQPPPPPPPIPNVAVPKSESAIDKDAIQKEDQEIAIDVNENKKKEMERTKELLAEVEHVLTKQNQETKKLVFDEIHKISDKVNEIKKMQETKNEDDDKLKENRLVESNKTLNADLAFKTGDTSINENDQLKKVPEPPVPLVKILADALPNVAENVAEHPIEKAAVNKNLTEPFKSLKIETNESKQEKIGVLPAPETNKNPNENIGRDLLSSAKINSGNPSVENNPLNAGKVKREEIGDSIKSVL